MYKTTRQFDDFWRQYPNVPRTNSKQSTRGNKKQAWLYWKMMPLYDRLAAASAVEHVHPDPYLYQAIRWLRLEGWESVTEPDPVAALAQKQLKMQRDKQREDDRHFIPFLSEQTPEYRQDYLANNPHHGWLIKEVEESL